MDFNLEKVDDITIVRFISKVLDASNAQEFKEKIAELIDQNRTLIFDMNEVDFVDSSGCGALLSCLRKIKSTDGKLILCNIKSQVKHLFNLIHMDRIFNVYNDCDDAIKSLETQS